MPDFGRRKTDTIPETQSLGISREVGWLLMLVCLLGSGLCFWQLPSGEFSADSPTVLQAAPEPEPQTRLLTRKIQDIRPGMRVLAENPELAGEFIEPLDIQPEDWRLITLEMSKPDGTMLYIELLRDLEWLEQTGASVDGVIQLDLAELGAAGAARVLALDGCPPIEQKEGRLVTGTFRHTAGNVIDLQISGLERPIGTTDNHPFWSEDRQEFVPAGELCIAETLRMISGEMARVTAVTRRTASARVYNLEVEGKHTYFVSDSGVLVHNSYTNTFVGDIGEHLVKDVLNERKGWKFLGSVQNGSGHGIDLVAEYTTKSGKSRLVFIEAKVNSARLSAAQKAGGQFFVRSRLDRAVNKWKSMDAPTRQLAEALHKRIIQADEPLQTLLMRIDLSTGKITTTPWVP